MSLFDEINSEADLLALIERQERESDVLEYKTATDRLRPSDRDEIAKDVSAFANSVGGLLVYGIAVDPKDKEVPCAIVPLDTWNVNYITRTTASAIRHPIDGIRTNIVSVEGGHVLLMDVPQSPLAPHQVVTTCRYYRRQGAESVPMQHDLIELYFGRRMHAKLEPVVLDFEPGKANHRLRLGLQNNGGQVGREVFTRLVTPASAPRLELMQVQVETKGTVTKQTGHGGTIAHEHAGELYYPGVPRHFLTLGVSEPAEILGREQPAFYLDVYAAGCRPYRYSLFLTRIGALSPRPSVEWEGAGLPPVIW